MTPSEIDAMARGYIVAALWTADEEIIPPKSGEFDPTPYLPRVSPAFDADARAVCARFASENAADLSEYPAEQAGHDLWLTRNGHGCGFWEADHCTQEEGERLTIKARALGERRVYANDRGQFDCQ